MSSEVLLTRQRITVSCEKGAISVCDQFQLKKWVKWFDADRFEHVRQNFSHLCAYLLFEVPEVVQSSRYSTNDVNPIRWSMLDRGLFEETLIRSCIGQ